MKNFLFGLLGFVLGMLVFTTVNQGNLFTDASQSNDDVILQIEGIAAMDKFNDKAYTLSIIEKISVIQGILPADSTAALAIEYLGALLSVKVSTLPDTPTIPAPVEEAHSAPEAEVPAAEAAREVPAAEVAREEAQTTKTTTDNAYRGTANTLPMIAPALQVKEEDKTQENSDEQAADLDGTAFNVGRRDIPKKVVKTERKTVSNPTIFNTLIDGTLYDANTCAALPCVEFGLNMNKGYSEATLMKECVATVCTDMKTKSRKSFESRKVEFNTAATR